MNQPKIKTTKAYRVWDNKYDNWDLIGLFSSREDALKEVEAIAQKRADRNLKKYPDDIKFGKDQFYGWVSPKMRKRCFYE